MQRRSLRAQRGVTLVEALVAMAVMAFGMLALVGVQTTLRLNADMARQRAEATRLAEEELEIARGFTTVGTGAGATEYDSLSNVATRVVQPADRSTDFKLTRAVINHAGGLYKTLKVTVTWVDRQGETRTVTLRNAVSRAAPELSGLLTSVKVTTAPGQRGGRHPTIPTRAGDLGDGTSGFKPQEGGATVWVFNNTTGVITFVCLEESGLLSSDLTSPTLLSGCIAVKAQLLAGIVRFNLRGGTLDLGNGTSAIKPVGGGTAAWLINNSLVMITDRCSVPAGTATQALVASDLTSCASAPYAITPASLASTALSAADAEAPVWPALGFDVTLSIKTDYLPRVMPTECFSESPASSALSVVPPIQGREGVAYYCIIHARSDGASSWAGASSLVPKGFSDGGATPWTLGAATGSFRVCRYTPSANQYAENADHPAVYSEWKLGCSPILGGPDSCRPVTGNLVNQNFLVIDGGQTCPTDTAIDPVAGKLTTYNTRQHQP